MINRISNVTFDVTQSVYILLLYLIALQRENIVGITID